MAVTMLELLGMLRRSHYSGISTSRGYNFPVILHFNGLNIRDLNGSLASVFIIRIPITLLSFLVLSS